MLTNLYFENFKSWPKSGKLQLAPITGLFGSNSSGKSSIIQSLLLLKQTAKSSDKKQPLNLGSKDDFVRLGSFSDIIYKHDLSRQLKISAQWNLEKPFSAKKTDSPNEVLFTSDNIAFSTVISSRQKDKLVTDCISYRLDGHKFTLEEKNATKKEYELKAESPTGFRFVRSPGRVWPLPGPTRCYGFPEHINAYYQNAAFLFDLELEFEKMLNSIYYLGPLREYPQRDYRWSGAEPEDVGQRGELSINAILSAQERGAYLSPGHRLRRQTIDERIAYWLKELGLIEDFSVQRISKSNLYEVKVKRTQNSSEVLLPDVGFGVSQVLPVLVLCYYAPQGSTILFEQPEIHLHPSVQAGLADVFIDVMKNRKIQVILESHSEHLLLRLQRRIADESIKNEAVSIYFSKTEKEHSLITPLELDLFGNVTNWPSDFFGDRFSEIAEREKAALKRTSH